MTHCESFYSALDKRLEQKMTIDQIAKDLCSGTKDPRRNMVLDIKEHKGEDWLVANAEWLGYQVQKHEKVKVALNCDVLKLPATPIVSEASKILPATPKEETLSLKETEKLVRQWQSQNHGNYQEIEKQIKVSHNADRNEISIVSEHDNEYRHQKKIENQEKKLNEFLKVLAGNIIYTHVARCNDSKTTKLFIEKLKDSVEYLTDVIDKLSLDEEKSICFVSEV